MRRLSVTPDFLPFDAWIDVSPARQPRMTRSEFRAWMRRARIAFDPTREAVVPSESDDPNDRGWRIVPTLALGDGVLPRRRRRMAKAEVMRAERRPSGATHR